MNARIIMDCGGKRSATPLFDDAGISKAVSPLRSATAVQKHAAAAMTAM